MGVRLRNSALIAGLVALMLPVAAYDDPAYAAGKKKPPAAQESDGEGGGGDPAKSAQLVQQIFDGGVKAYGVGKYEEALRAFEAAIRAGMPSQQMPRVLYYRGLTFRKLGKPGFAVSDLTSALWLKGGLSEAERADAIKNRALAFHESGVSEVPAVPQSAYAQAPAMPGSGPQAAPTATASSAPAAPAAPSGSSSGGGIGGFFSNLFGGGSSSEQSEAPPASTASIENASSGDAAGWGAATEVVPHSSAKRAPEISAPFMTQVAAASERGHSTDSPSAGSVTGGGIRLQVAAVRSRSEAEALAGLLVGRHAGQLAGRKPEVDQSVIGSMGTFYRVRIGPYSNEQEPQQLCNELKADGFDCLIVTE